MRKILTKICGVTRVEDALAAVEYGADLIGLIFVPKSPRMVSDEAAQAIAAAVAGRAKVVGVFQNENADVVAEKRRMLKLDFVQLHGDESASVTAITRPCIKVLIDDGSDFEQLVKQYSPVCDYLLFDLPKNAESGGKRRPLQDLKTATPFFMAGGINPHNVGPIAAALIGNRSFVGVDVASGVESAPGVKDQAKMRALIEKVQEVSLNAVAR
jgi:phosphoribosylanthranilate isomerase